MPLLSTYEPDIPEPEKVGQAWTVTLEDGTRTAMYTSALTGDHFDVSVLGDERTAGFQLQAQREYQAPNRQHRRPWYAFYVRLYTSPIEGERLDNMDVRGPFAHRTEAIGELYAWLSELLPGAEIEPIDESE